MIGKIINVLYPYKCIVCEKTLIGNKQLCKECEGQIHIIKEPRCVKCGKSLIDQEKLYCTDCKTIQRCFDKAVAIFDYSGKLKKSIKRFKYDNVRVYGNFYGEVAVNIYGKQIEQWKIDAIVPVPIYKKKQVKRGYNQALVFGKALSKYTGIPLQEQLLIRIKDTVPQKDLADTMRYINLKDAFAIDRDKLGSAKNILLVDDIFTTGSTLDACSRILKKTGVKKVYGLCIAAGRDNKKLE